MMLFEANVIGFSRNIGINVMVFFYCHLVDSGIYLIVYSYEPLGSVLNEKMSK